MKSSYKLLPVWLSLTCIILGCAKNEPSAYLTTILDLEHFGNEVRVYVNNEDISLLKDHINENLEQFLARFESSEGKKNELEVFLSKTLQGKCVLMSVNGTLIKKKEFQIRFNQIFGPTMDTVSVGPKPQPFIEKTSSNKMVERNAE